MKLLLSAKLAVRLIKLKASIERLSLVDIVPEELEAGFEAKSVTFKLAIPKVLAAVLPETVPELRVPEVNDEVLDIEDKFGLKDEASTL